MALTHQKTQSLTSLEQFIAEEVPLHDYTVAHEDLIESCRGLLARVFPAWDLAQVAFVQCKDGITNKLVKCTHGAEEVVLVRAYGKKSELIINRLAELTNFVTLSKAGLSPPLYARFTNGFVYGYIEGRPFRPPDMAERRLGLLVARKVAVWHRLHLPGTDEPLLFPTLWKWFDHGIPREYAVPETQANFAQHVDRGHLRRELVRLEGVLTRLQSPIVFCHNDLLSANIILTPDERDVAFIDFEYGCHNYRGYDIGNHFCEFAGFDCDYTRYPTREQQLPWLAAYHRQFYGAAPTDEQLERLYLEANLFGLASHLYWGLWGLVQAAVSDIPFDYMAYAIMRFRQYEATKEHWYGLYDTTVL